ncbi:hypothetical protein [Pelomonas sp. SE-A7]|uniref:hypothetical protein n=1 Tax=Pelomonas sp. SE-A7 TaxID=3054953 RepID=UPI00259D0F8F|nr:hypothetical protein [Pelomonas sp. SE-A7]MDM4768217.1 hypothetical protein [Pelomonas sp. SE-A7]
MSKPNDNEPRLGPSGESEPVMPVANPRRRRLLKAGVGVSPVLLSLGSKPAMAGNFPCAHHNSGWASAGSRSTVDNGDHSSHNSGCNPTYWKNCSNSVWTNLGCSKSNTKFSSCLGSAPPSNICADKLYDALNCSDPLIQHFAASYLNCKSSKYGSNTIMNETNLRAWWPLCKAANYASIGSAGKLWDRQTKVKEVLITNSADSRYGGFLNLMQTINTRSS